MTDNSEKSVLELRHEALDMAHTNIGEAVENMLSAKEPSKDDMLTFVNGLLAITSIVAAALAEISHSVGIIAAMSQADFEAAVNDEAEIRAETKHQETIKRSFIGQRKN